MASSSLNQIGLELLIKTHLAKQVVFRGVAVFIVHGLHRIMKGGFARFIDQHHGLHPFRAYLRPAQLGVEALSFLWDYSLCKFMTKKRLPCGGFTSPAHCVAFSDSASQVFCPTGLRWVMTFFVLSNSEITEGLTMRSAEETTCTSRMQCLRTFGHKTISAVERKLNDRTPRTWKSIFFGQVLELSLDYGNCVLLNAAFFKMPFTWRNTPVKYYALRFGILLITYTTLSGVTHLLNQTALMPVWTWLQDFHDAQPPPLAPLSSYAEYDHLAWCEIGFLLEDTRRIIALPELPQSERVGLLVEVERLTGYMTGVQRRVIPRSEVTRRKFGPLGVKPRILVANDFSAAAAASVDPPVFVHPTVEDTQKVSYCVNCRRQFSVQQGDLGKTVAEMDPGCGHVLCNQCEPSYDLDCCLVCGCSLETISDAKGEELWSQHLLRSKRLLDKIRQKNLSVSSSYYLPTDVLYSSWQDVAYVAIRRGHFSRITAYNCPMDIVYCPADTWAETTLNGFISLLDVEPVGEGRGTLCPMPFLWGSGRE